MFVTVEGGGGVCRERMLASLCLAMVQYGILPNFTKLYPKSILEYSDLPWSKLTADR